MNPYHYDRYARYQPPGYYRSAINEILCLLIVFAVSFGFIYYAMLFFGEDYCDVATPTYRSACLHRGVLSRNGSPGQAVR